MASRRSEIVCLPKNVVMQNLAKKFHTHFAFEENLVTNVTRTIPSSPLRAMAQPLGWDRVQRLLRADLLAELRGFEPLTSGVNGVLGLASVELRFVSRSSTPVRLPLRSCTRVDDRDGCRTGD
jgi:hypothetical protein